MKPGNRHRTDYRRLGFAFMAALAVWLWAAPLSNSAESLPRLRVSENHHFLVTDSGQPFFWLGDTAWELFHRLDREKAEQYLDNRAQKGFTVIQAVVLAELDGLVDKNPYGQVPLLDNDPTRPNEDYFKHVGFYAMVYAPAGRRFEKGGTRRISGSEVKLSTD